MENKKNIAEIMSVTMSGLREMVNVNTIVGEPVTTADGTTIIPVTRLSMGFGSGGVTAENSGTLGGGGAGGVKVSPVAFLIVNEQSVKLLPMTGQAETTLDKVVDMIPKLVKQAETLIEKYKKKEDNDE
jgi:sporulation protein YtfJ